MTTTAVRKNLQYRARTAGERTSLATVLVSNGFGRVAGISELPFDTHGVIEINTADKTFNFVEKRDKEKCNQVNLGMILNNEFRVKREIERKYVGFIGGYSCYMQPEGMKAGCQTITFDQIQACYDAMLKMKEEIAKGEYIDL